MRVPKKFLMLLFMTAALIFISGCGSDSSYKATSSAPKTWFNADTFTKRYNTAIDFAGENMNKDFSSLKIDTVKTVVFSDGESARLIVVKSDKYNDGVTGYGNFLPLPLDDKDVWQAGYSGAYHGNESGATVGNYAILYAVIKAFPELDDLNTDEIFSRLMDKNKNNAQVTLEENGLRVEARRFFDDLSVTITNIELERRHEEQQQQFQAAKDAQRNEQSPPPAQNNQSAPATNQPAQNAQSAPAVNQPADNNSSALSLGGIGLNDSIEKVRQVLGREDRITGDPTNSKHEYKDIVITYNGRRILGMVSYSPAVKTERNIHEGSTLQEVINAYGRRCAVQNFDGATLYEYPYDTPQGSLAVMRFAVKNGVVDYISLRIVTDAKEKSDILAAMKTL